MKNSLLLSGAVLVSGALAAQCSFTGLPLELCELDSAVTLTATGAGFFSGPGISGNTFDPAMAGPGLHTINYDEADPNIYTVDTAGTYSPLPGSGTALILGDDQVSGVLPIGFTFTFFGNTYTDLYVSSNGFITFSAGMPSGCCSGQLIPNTLTVNNEIAFSWDDMYPPGNGTIEYFTTGTAPFQTFVLNFFDIPFCCGSVAAVKTQVILYESTNIIEIHTEYANGVSPGTMGIENIDGTVAYAVPGRNSSAWPSLVNDYVAFIPQLCSVSQNIQVHPAPIITGTASPNPACVGDNVTFTGSGANSFSWDQGITDGTPTTVTSSGTYVVTGTESLHGCSNTDTLELIVHPNPMISLSSNDEMLGNDGSINLTILGGIPPYSFDWSNDGTGDNDDSNDLFGVPAGSYNVTMTDGNGCTVTASATVGSQVGIEELQALPFSIHPNPSNGQFEIELNNSTQGELLITDATGRKVLEMQLTSHKSSIDISKELPGTYFIKVVTESTSGVTPITVQ